MNTSLQSDELRVQKSDLNEVFTMILDFSGFLPRDYFPPKKQSCNRLQLKDKWKIRIHFHPATFPGVHPQQNMAILYQKICPKYPTPIICWSQKPHTTHMSIIQIKKNCDAFYNKSKWTTNTCNHMHGYHTCLVNYTYSDTREYTPCLSIYNIQKKCKAIPQCVQMY